MNSKNHNEQEPKSLVSLRQDLQFLGKSSGDGDETMWLLFDPVQNKYHKLDKLSFLMLSQWSKTGEYTALVKALIDLHGVLIDEEDVEQLETFLINQGLCELLGHDVADQIQKRREQRKNSFLWALIHNYLFFKIPLFYPNGFVASIMPWVKPLLGRNFAIFMLALSALAFYLTAKQWDTFLTTFSEIFTLQYLAIYLLVLIFVKIMHELGHAFVAAKHKCRIPSMGVAFILAFPVLYTDVSDAWRLSSKRKRLEIDFAGIAAELYLAVIATLFWVFLPEGIAKSLAFSVATTGWILSLAINLNPFMRFDGYYILSDFLGVDNLQHRSFELGRWRIREFLFKPNLPCPEDLPEMRIKLLILYAWVTWIYRFFLFLGIALLVYHFAFKILGIFLFAVEIVWFILRPIFNELKLWSKLIPGRAEGFRTGITALVLAGCLICLAIPFPFRVSVPAIIEPQNFIRIYAPEASKISELNIAKGQHVEQGDVLMRLLSEDLEQALKINSLEIAEAAAELRQSLIDIKTRNTVPLIRERIRKLKELRNGVLEKQKKLIITAPMSGEVVSLAKDLTIDRWVKATTPLISIVAKPIGNAEKSGDIAQTARGYISEADLTRVKLGNKGLFVPEDPMLEKVEVNLTDLHVSNIEMINYPYLASIYGGAVPVKRREQNQLQIVDAYYATTFSVLPLQPLDRVYRGTILVEAENVSLLYNAFSRISAVLIRELGI